MPSCSSKGVSDKVALETLAVRRGRDLEAEGVSVTAVGGAQAIGRFLNLYGPRGSNLRLAGLCDVGEEGSLRRALERAGVGSRPRPRRDGAAWLLRVRAGSRGRVGPLPRRTLPWRRSSPRTGSWDRSAPTRSNPRIAGERPRNSSAVSSRTGRSDLRRRSSRRSISIACPARWTACSRTSDAIRR